MALFSAEGWESFWSLFRGNGEPFCKISVCNYNKKYQHSGKRFVLIGKYLTNLHSTCSHKYKNKWDN